MHGDPVVALALAPLQQSQPPKDRVFYARHHTALKWTPYKPNSQEVKRGKMGRWQELRPYGIGWQNSDVSPEAGAWVEDILNDPHRTPAPAGDVRVDEAQVRAIAGDIYADVADEPLGDLSQRRDRVQTQWFDAVRSALTTHLTTPDSSAVSGSAEGLREIMREVLPHLEEGYMEGEADDEPIGWVSDAEGKNQQPMKLTFGMVRRFRKALTEWQQS